VKNLETIKKWIGGWTLKRKKDISEEELKAIKALEKDGGGNILYCTRT